MIIGIGTDLVEIARVAASIERLGERFIDRILTDSEKAQWADIANVSKAAAFVAKRFAGKEAAVKALGTGIGRGVSFQHFEISNLPTGQPILTVAKSVEQRFGDNLSWHITLSDEQAYAQAFVILEAKG